MAGLFYFGFLSGRCLCSCPCGWVSARFSLLWVGCEQGALGWYVHTSMRTSSVFVLRGKRNNSRKTSSINSSVSLALSLVV